MVLASKASATLRFPRFSELNGIEESVYEKAIYLFAIDNDCFYLVHQVPEGQPEFELKDIGLFPTSEPRHLAFAGITGYSLYKWYDNHQFCSHCGAKLVPHEKERMLHCLTCNNTEYPKIMPAVIIAVTNGNKILLSKYANREYTRYALLAGFTEIGETAEETVKREVMEEVGLTVKNIRYYKSQPWGFDSNLLLGYFCELAEEEEIHLDEEELSVAEWVDYHDVPEDREKLSLTHEMMTYFKEQRRR